MKPKTIAVFVDIFGAVGKILGIVIPYLIRVLEFRKYTVKKLHVGWMIHGMELPQTGMGKDGDSPFSNEGLFVIQAKTIRECLVSYQNGVDQGQIGIIGLVRNTKDSHIGLLAHFHHLLLVERIQSLFMNRRDMPGANRNHLLGVGRVQDRLNGKKPFIVPGQLRFHQIPHLPQEFLKRRAFGIHDRLAAGASKGPVMVADTLITAQTDHNGFPSPVEGEAGNIDIKQLVRFHYGSI